LTGPAAVAVAGDQPVPSKQRCTDIHYKVVMVWTDCCHLRLLDWCFRAALLDHISLLAAIRPVQAGSELRRNSIVHINLW